MDEIRSNGKGKTKIGLALAGGGLEGAIWEIGALRALDEALDGFDFNDAYCYVGVSAGAFLGACLANNLTTAQMCRAIVSSEPGEHPFVAETFLTPSFRHLWQGGATLPRLLAEALRDWSNHPGDKSLLEALTRLARALPVGLFDNEPIRAYLEKIYTIKDRTDDFRELGKRLIVVAAELDSGQAVRFGEPGFDHVPISTAVSASSALPGLYPPVEIEGRHFVDGVLHKTLHASIPLEAGADLVLCLNPIVPVDTANLEDTKVHGGPESRRLVDWGLPAVLSQTFRTLIRSRLDIGFPTYARKFPAADVVLFEPERNDYTMFFTNIFGFADRRAVAEHAYRATRADLARRASELAPILARHGVTLRTDILEEPRDLWSGVGLGGHSSRRGRRADHPPKPETVHRLDEALERLDRWVAQR